MKSKNLTEIIFCCVIMLFLAVLIVMSRGLPANSARLPLLVGWVTLAFTLIQLVINIRERIAIEKNKDGSDGSDAEKKPFITRELLIRVGVTCLFMVLTLVLWYLLGFLPAALISSMLLAFYLGERRWYVIVLSCGISVVALYFLFSELLSVPLPKGIFFGGYW